MRSARRCDALLDFGAADAAGRPRVAASGRAARRYPGIGPNAPLPAFTASAARADTTAISAVVAIVVIGFVFIIMGLEQRY
jgi:hypothetical protein